MFDQRSWLPVLVPLVVAAALYLPGIGQRVLYIGDEARYALLARNMVETGDWLVPRLGAEVHLEKSPLYIWSIAVLSLAGRKVTELTAVLPSALSGIGGVGATLMLGRRLFGPRAGWLSALIVTIAWGYFWHARMALADMMVTAFAIGAAAAFATIVVTGRSRRGPMAVCWACLGLGLAAKGPVALMPLIPFGVFLVGEHGWRGLGKLRLLTGLAIVVLISAPWALAFALGSGESYLQSVVLGDFVGPRLRGWDSGAELFFAAGPIGVGFLPWTPFLPFAVARGLRSAEDAHVSRSFRFLLFWVAAYVIVITLLPHKRDRYLLATYPILAVMVGWLWDRWAAEAFPRALRAHAWIWGGLALGMAALALAPLRARPEIAVLLPAPLAGKLVLAGLLLATAILTVLAVRRGRPLTAFAALWIPMALVLAYEARVYVVQHNRQFDVKGLAERLADRAAPADAVVAYRYQQLALEFYAGRPVRRLTRPDELESLAAAGRPVYVVADERAWPIPGDGAGRSWDIVERTTIAGRRLVVATTPVPR